MEYKNPLFAVKDMEASLEFYRTVLGLEVVQDFGANKTLTGGLCLQTLESWREFLGVGAVSFGGNDGEVYFEEEDFDAFAAKLERIAVSYVHPVREHRWGQRAVRFYDPDGHIIEVGESMRSVCRRFLDGGMTMEETARRMDVPVEYIEKILG